MNRTHAHAVFPAIALALFAAACTRTAALPPIPTGETVQYLPGKIIWHALLTEDVERAKQFYGALCGWTFEPVIDSPYTTIRNGNRDIGTIVHVTHAEGMQITQWLSFMSVEDVDKATELCEAQGQVLRAPLDMAQFGRIALVKDPAGAPLGLIRSLTGDPADGVEPAIDSWIWSDYVTTDVQAGADFYRQMVGYESTELPRDGGKSYWLLEGSGRKRAGMFEAPEGVGANWLPYLRVENAQTAMEKAKELGATVLLEPNPDIRNASSAVIRDPDGAVLVLQHYPF